METKTTRIWFNVKGYTVTVDKPADYEITKHIAECLYCLGRGHQPTLGNFCTLGLTWCGSLNKFDKEILGKCEVLSCEEIVKAPEITGPVQFKQ